MKPRCCNARFLYFQFNLIYLVGVALICVGNLAFFWRPVLSLEDLSSLIGSSGSSGDTEVSILSMIPAQYYPRCPRSAQTRTAATLWSWT